MCFLQYLHLTSGIRFSNFQHSFLRKPSMTCCLVFRDLENSGLRWRASPGCACASGHGGSSSQPDHQRHSDPLAKKLGDGWDLGMDESGSLKVYRGYMFFSDSTYCVNLFVYISKWFQTWTSTWTFWMMGDRWICINMYPPFVDLLPRHINQISTEKHHVSPASKFMSCRIWWLRIFEI